MRRKIVKVREEAHDAESIRMNVLVSVLFLVGVFVYYKSRQPFFRLESLNL